MPFSLREKGGDEGRAVRVFILIEGYRDIRS